MDARKFWTACRVHDWHYNMADDDGAYRAGHDHEESLRRMAEADPKLMEIFKAWESYHRDCGPRPLEPKLED